MTRTIAVAIFALFAVTTPAFAGSIEPEMIIRFKNGTIACLSRDNLTEIIMHGMRGEATKMRAMMVDHGGDCIMIPSTKRLKVLSAEYNDPDTDIGVLEIVGEDKITLNGAWALSVGAEEVTAKDRPSKR